MVSGGRRKAERKTTDIWLLSSPEDRRPCFMGSFALSLEASLKNSERKIRKAKKACVKAKAEKGLGENKPKQTNKIKTKQNKTTPALLFGIGKICYNQWYLIWETWAELLILWIYQWYLQITMGNQEGQIRLLLRQGYDEGKQAQV